MNKSIIRLAYAIPLLVSACLLTGCGGTKVLKEPEPMQITQALGAVSDQQVTATLDWVIVRDGPGSWAKNADWDEYLLSVNNQSDQPISVTGLVVVDSLDTQIEPQAGRKKLVKSSKVNTQIELRQTTLPIEIPASGDVNLDVFFPLAPSPKRVELTYTDANGENTLVIDTSVALNGLHMGANTE